MAKRIKVTNACWAFDRFGFDGGKVYVDGFDRLGIASISYYYPVNGRPSIEVLFETARRSPGVSCTLQTSGTSWSPCGQRSGITLDTVTSIPLKKN